MSGEVIVEKQAMLGFQVLAEASGEDKYVISQTSHTYKLTYYLYNPYIFFYMLIKYTVKHLLINISSLECFLYMDT